MLSDSERRTLDATAALLALDDPRLAAQLGQHRLIPPRRPGRERPTPAPTTRPARSWRIGAAAWPPLVMIALCLTLLLLPSVLAGRGRAAEAPAPRPTTTQVVTDGPVPRELAGK
ncbi:hypothetical protein [Actinomycetospora atypica]|uniref:DUF3040 domain-containing protein n=1 Tax=Actinomycetospora atypica TaxID=1290095 RepID=A0ABV9YQE7_9PSEU